MKVKSKRQKDLNIFSIMNITMDDEVFLLNVNKNLKEKMQIYDEEYWNNFAQEVIIKTLNEIEKVK